MICSGINRTLLIMTPSFQVFFSLCLDRFKGWQVNLKAPDL
jgi:hypothetical protein